MYILGVYVSKECNEIYGFILFVKDMKRNEWIFFVLWWKKCIELGMLCFKWWDVGWYGV